MTKEENLIIELSESENPSDENVGIELSDSIEVLSPSLVIGPNEYIGGEGKDSDDFVSREISDYLDPSEDLFPDEAVIKENQPENEGSSSGVDNEKDVANITLEAFSAIKKPQELSIDQLLDYQYLAHKEKKPLILNKISFLLFKKSSYLRQSQYGYEDVEYLIIKLAEEPQLYGKIYLERKL